MKRKWEEPRILVQEFIPNEYVAVCWGVACSTGDANKYEASIHNSAQDHRAEYCGTKGHQWLRDRNEDGTPESMLEIDTDGLGRLECTIYTDGTYGQRRDISTVKVDDYIYWTTSAGFGQDMRTWHHQGLVTETTPGHPNRS